MISYLVTSKHRYTLGPYLAQWAGNLSRRIRILPYEVLARFSKFEPGTYIFSDLDRVSSIQIEPCSRVWDQLEQADGAVRLLNHPLRVLRRYELLRKMYLDRRNLFCAYRLSEDRSQVRFPVFVHQANEHDGSLTPLLSNAQELDWAILKLLFAGYRSKDLLIVEFCNTADSDGIFRKYPPCESARESCLAA